MIEVRSLCQGTEVAQTQFGSSQSDFLIRRGSCFKKTILGPYGQEKITGYIIKREPDENSLRLPMWWLWLLQPDDRSRDRGSD